MSANYGVISWTMQGGDLLNPEEFFFFFFFFFFIDCSHIYKHYINSVIITLLTDIICTKLQLQYNVN